jgi:DNA-binding transcriptional ArsR family regulator
LTASHRRVLFNHMVKYKDSTLDTVFGALADPTRRGILALLRERDNLAVGELAAPFSISAPAVTKHLKVLEAAGLLGRDRDGRIIRCRLQPEPMKAAMQWLERYEVFWNQRLDALSDYLEAKTRGEPWPSPRNRASPSSGGSRRRSKPSSKPGPTRRN